MTQLTTGSILRIFLLSPQRHNIWLWLLLIFFSFSLLPWWFLWSLLYDSASFDRFLSAKGLPFLATSPLSFLFLVFLLRWSFQSHDLSISIWSWQKVYISRPDLSWFQTIMFHWLFNVSTPCLVDIYTLTRPKQN